MVAEKDNIKNMEKQELITKIDVLNAIIENINTENSYDKVVEFFQITSELQDQSEELKGFLPPIKGWKFLGLKSSQLKKSEAKRLEAEKMLEKFISKIQKAGRDQYGHNRTKRKQKVTKNNVFFGDVGGIWTFSVQYFEKECAKDLYVQLHIRNQITSFVRSYRNSFNTNWINN